jgi:hypothetical protein
MAVFAKLHRCSIYGEDPKSLNGAASAALCFSASPVIGKGESRIVFFASFRLLACLFDPLRPIKSGEKCIAASILSEVVLLIIRRTSGRPVPNFHLRRGPLSIEGGTPDEAFW